MAIDFDADLEEMLSSDDHGVSVTWNSTTFEGIFNKEFFVEEGGVVGTATSEPMLYVRDSLIDGMQRGDAITVDGTAYTVGIVEPDGTGLTMVRLNG